MPLPSEYVEIDTIRITILRLQAQSYIKMKKSYQVKVGGKELLKKRDTLFT